MLTQDQILKDIFKDREFRKITRSIVKPRFDLVDDIMQDAFIVLWDNRERLNLVECYQRNPKEIKYIFWKWCFFTYNSNATQKRYGLNVSNVSVTDNISPVYEYKPEEDYKKKFEEHLFFKGLKSSKNDTEEDYYSKGILRQHLDVKYDSNGNLIQDLAEYKPSRTIQDLTGINYVTVTKDVKKAFEHMNLKFSYIYKESK